MYKPILTLILFCQYQPALSQIHFNAQERFFLLNYLVQGKRTGHFLPATTDKKGNCSFEYQCKKYFFGPQSDTISTLYKYWITPIATYALSDSLTYYDSLHFRIYPYDDSAHTGRYDILDLSRIYAKIPFTTEEQRLVSLLTILPFHTDYKYSKDTTEVTLTRIQAFSPRRSTEYINTLCYVIYDYVYRKRRVPVVITYREDDTRYRYFMKPVEGW